MNFSARTISQRLIKNIMLMEKNDCIKDEYLLWKHRLSCHFHLHSVLFCVILCSLLVIIQYALLNIINDENLKNVKFVVFDSVNLPFRQVWSWLI